MKYIQRNGETSITHELIKKCRHLSNCTLYGATLVRHEVCRGTKYVALEYVIVPFEHTFARDLKLAEPKIGPCKGVHFSGNRMLASSSCVKGVRDALITMLENDGLLREDAGDKRLRVLMEVRREGYYLCIGSVCKRLKGDDLLDLVAGAVESDASRFSLLDRKGNTLEEGEKFLFQFRAPGDGYVTLFNVYEDGRVALMEKNLPVKQEEAIVLPPRTSFERSGGDALLATPLEGHRHTRDLYVTVWSEEKVSIVDYVEVDDVPVSGEPAYTLDTLLELLYEQTGFGLSTVIWKDDDLEEMSSL